MLEEGERISFWTMLGGSFCERKASIARDSRVWHLCNNSARVWKDFNPKAILSSEDFKAIN
jgi:hypothetical protein